MEQYVQLTANSIYQQPITLAPDRTLLDARDKMLGFGISRVIVAKDKKALGIVTEKDMSRILYTDLVGKKLDEINIEDVMSKSLVSVNENSGLNICARLMLDNKISSVVVLDDERKLKGIVTKSDLVGVYAEKYRGKNLVRDYMTSNVLTVTPENTTYIILSTLVLNNISRVVVVEDHHVVGVITGRDLLPIGSFFGIGAHGNLKFDSKDGLQSKLFTPVGIGPIFLAKDVMTHDPTTVTYDSDLAFAAQVISNNKWSGLPVVGENRMLRGIITKTDIVSAFAAN